MLIEVILDLLICDVDAELLKTVVVEILETKNIQDPNWEAISTETMHIFRGYRVSKLL